MRDFRQREQNNVDRIVRNQHAPADYPRYTELGIKKGKLPPRAFEILRNRWDSGKDRAIIEPWPASDCHTNYYEVGGGFPVYLSVMGDDHRHWMELMNWNEYDWLKYTCIDMLCFVA